MPEELFWIVTPRMLLLIKRVPAVGTLAACATLMCIQVEKAIAKIRATLNATRRLRYGFILMSSNTKRFAKNLCTISRVIGCIVRRICQIYLSHLNSYPLVECFATWYLRFVRMARAGRLNDCFLMGEPGLPY